RPYIRSVQFPGYEPGHVRVSNGGCMPGVPMSYEITTAPLRLVVSRGGKDCVTITAPDGEVYVSSAGLQHIPMAAFVAFARAVVAAHEGLGSPARARAADAATLRPANPYEGMFWNQARTGSDRYMDALYNGILGSKA